jgi:hypothetical protein
MDRQSPPLPEEHRRRRHDAHERAAEAHEHAAQKHDETAAFMDEHSTRTGQLSTVPWPKADGQRPARFDG